VRAGPPPPPGRVATGLLVVCNFDGYSTVLIPSVGPVVDSVRSLIDVLIGRDVSTACVFLVVEKEEEEDGDDADMEIEENGRNNSGRYANKTYNTEKALANTAKKRVHA